MNFIYRRQAPRVGCESHFQQFQEYKLVHMVFFSISKQNNTTRTIRNTYSATKTIPPTPTNPAAALNILIVSVVVEDV